jgi:hypothetical protein
MNEETKCRLLDDKLIVVPHDPGEPPNWAPVRPGMQLVILDRKEFDELKVRKYDRPCDICPDEIKERCNENNSQTRRYRVS